MTQSACPCGDTGFSLGRAAIWHLAPLPFSLCYALGVANPLFHYRRVVKYWDSLIKKRQWVCEIFVECTALLLQHDIHIISTSSTPDQPWLVISGNIEDPNVPCEGLPLLIGSKTDIHYQSLLPAPLQPVRTPSSQPESRQAGRGSSPSPSPPQKRSRQSLVQSQSEQAVSQAESSQCLSPSQAEEEIFKRPESLPPNFTFEFEQFSIEFPCKSADFLMECPLCKTRTKYIVNHIVKKVECQKNINPLHFEYQFKKYKANQLAEKRKLSNQARQAAFKARQRVHQSFNHLKGKTQNRKQNLWQPRGKPTKKCLKRKR